MTAWKAGMLITAERLLDDTPTTTTSGFTAATGWSLNDFTAYRVGNVIEFRAYIARTGANITQTNSNITDTQIGTLPSGWRPTSGTTVGFWGDGLEGGDFVYGTDGICTLRTATADIPTGRNVRLHGVFIVD